MNHFVPDFDTSTDDDYVNVNSNSTKPIMGGEEDELMELLWQNGQVVVQNQRLINNTKKLSSSTVSLHAGEEGVAPATSTLHHHHEQQQQRELDQNLFIHEDEMTSWLHYPLRDDDFCSDLLFSASAPTTTTATTMTQTTAAKPPVSSSSVKPPVRNFMNFSRMRGDFTRPSVSKPIVRESTQVKPIATPSSAAAETSVSGLTWRTDLTVNRGSDLTRRTDLTVNCGSSSAVAGDGRNTLEVNRKGKAVAEPASEIPGTSSKSEIEPVNIQPETEKTIVDERKRKERETTTIDDTESPSEETNKQGRGRTTCTKRSRAAEVHNLSERKRRDRINERMKALQELIPRCNKSDKASMLDEAIEYMKSLQLQVQMMSMGCGMMPMMYTGMQQQYMAMGMGMGMGMNQPLPPPPTFMPFPNMLAPQRPFPTQTHAPDPSRVYLPNQQYDPTSNQPQFPGYVDPYQQFRNLYPTQPPQFQNQATSYPSSSRVSSSKESEDQGNHTTG